MSEPKKSGIVLGNYIQNEFTPAIVNDLKSKNIETTPYVNVEGTMPEKGFAQFFDSPRYTTGFSSLFNSIGFVVETHMLKSYKNRVKATYDFMLSTINYTENNYKKIKQIRKQNQLQFQVKSNYTLKWAIDSSKVSKIPFMGFEAGFKKSDVTSGERLFYDRNKPFTKEIPFYAEYKSVYEIKIPKAYLVPKSQWKVIDLLKENHLNYKIIKNDTLVEVESYRIVDYKTSKNPYEGHYPHSNTKVISSTQKIKFFTGDYLFPTNQFGVKYLLETLEPEAVDSFFNWNFFDTILQQKEGYSEYVFEDLANDYLNKNPDLRSKLEQKKKVDNKFAENPESQLDWVHKNSIYYEKAHLQYPIYRVN